MDGNFFSRHDCNQWFAGSFPHLYSHCWNFFYLIKQIILDCPPGLNPYWLNNTVGQHVYCSPNTAVTCPSGYYCQFLPRLAKFICCGSGVINIGNNNSKSAVNSKQNSYCINALACAKGEPFLTPLQEDARSFHQNSFFRSISIVQIFRIWIQLCARIYSLNEASV